MLVVVDHKEVKEIVVDFMITVFALTVTPVYVPGLCLKKCIVLEFLMVWDLKEKAICIELLLFSFVSFGPSGYTEGYKFISKLTL